MIFYISENLPHLFTDEALLIAECLADYYGTEADRYSFYRIPKTLLMDLR